MPEYLYLCTEGHKKIINENMFADKDRYCKCGKKMWRKPQTAHVNWGGLKPSEGGISPLAREMDEGAPARRDWYAGMKEEHESNSK